MPSRRYLVAGLGNPGPDYRETRHNVGFRVVDAISERYAISLTCERFDAVFGSGSAEGVAAVLAKPLAFMNRSGVPVGKIAQFYRISSEDILVIHDDIDLAFGRLKIKEKGGDGGHKGIRSIIDALGRDDFSRLRIGIGRSRDTTAVTDHVLGNFGPDELPMLDRIIRRSVEAVVTILCRGTKDGMNRFNNRSTTIYS